MDSLCWMRKPDHRYFIFFNCNKWYEVAFIRLLRYLTTPHHQSAVQLLTIEALGVFPVFLPEFFFMQDSFQKFFQFIPKIRTVFNWFNRLSFKHFSHSSRYFLLNFCRSFSRGLFQYFFRGFSYRFSKLLPDFRKYFLLEFIPRCPSFVEIHKVLLRIFKFFFPEFLVRFHQDCYLD